MPDTDALERARMIRAETKRLARGVRVLGVQAARMVEDLEAASPTTVQEDTRERDTSTERDDTAG